VIKGVFIPCLPAACFPAAGRRYSGLRMFLISLIEWIPQMRSLLPRTESSCTEVPAAELKDNQLALF